MKDLLKKVFKLPKPSFKSKFQKISYSQCGEDMIVDYVFQLRGICMPTYFDIGANHPYYLSNTAMFYEKGCKGIIIEANPNLIRDFKENRPDDIILNVGVASEENELDFYIMQDNTLSTFSKSECDTMIADGKQLLEIKKVKLTTVSRIITNYCSDIFPDFLSIDVEGLDFDIIKTLEFSKTSPKVICVEAAEYSPIGAGKRKNDLIEYLVSKDYYEYANTNLNAIMVRRDFWFI